MSGFRSRWSWRTDAPACALVTVFLALASAAGSLEAQVGGARSLAHEVFAGSEVESYLRALHITASGQPVPWSVRAFGPREIERLLPGDSAHPWLARYDLRPRRRGTPYVAPIGPGGGVVYNSAFPYGANDGPVWAGRGFTSTLTGGVAAGVGPISLQVAPIAFRAGNGEFELRRPDLPEPLVYRDSRGPSSIDRPQRFGTAPYSRVDPGESTLRLDLPVLAAGVSTASQHWGPAREFPLLMGTNAGGFPHAFVGTSAPLNLWLGALQLRLIGGVLDQSEYSPVQTGERRRFLSGLVGTFSPRGMHGLEVGLGRTYGSPWPADGLEAGDLLRPFQGFLKEGLQRGGENPDDLAEDQRVSVFARWAPPRSGFEVYGEFIREDHSFDLRHFLLEANDLSGFMVGFARSWRHRDGRLTLLRAESMSTENARRGRSVFAGQHLFEPYDHSGVRQGHTQRGQLLVPDAARGGGGGIVGVDHYHGRGRWSLEWRREQRESRELAPVPGAPPAVDVIHALSVDGVWFAGAVDVVSGLAFLYDFDRNMSSDVAALSLTLALRAAW